MEASVLKCLDFPTSEVCSNFNGQNERNRWSVLVVQELDDPLALRIFDTMFDVIKAEELLWLQTIELILLPEFGVDGGTDAPPFDDNFGDAFFLGDRLHSPTRLGKCMRKADNMPQLLIHLRLLNTCDSMDAKLGRRWWSNLLHGWRGLINNGEESCYLRSSDSFTGTWAREVDSVGAVRLIVGCNGRLGFEFLQSEHLYPLKVRIASAKLFSTRHVKKCLLQHIRIASLLSTTLSFSSSLLGPTLPEPPLRN